MDVKGKADLAKRLLTYFEKTGCEVQCIKDSKKISSWDDGYPAVKIYRLKGDWRRKFQVLDEILSYKARSYSENYEKFMAHFAEWYCNEFPGIYARSKPFTDFKYISGDSFEELSMKLAVNGY